MESVATYFSGYSLFQLTVLTVSKLITHYPTIYQPPAASHRVVSSAPSFSIYSSTISLTCSTHPLHHPNSLPTTLKFTPKSHHPSPHNLSKDCLDSVFNWAKTWQIGISYSKCNFITIGDQFASQFSISNFKFTIANESITKSDTIKDLGVYVDHKLDFKKHINGLVMGSKQQSALIFRSFISRDTPFNSRLYTYLTFDPF